MKTWPTIAGAALALCLALPAQADLTSDLMAYWTFDACNGVDDTGRGHDMTLFGTPPEACVDGPKGKRSAFPFNGTNNYFLTPTSADFSVKTNVTYSAWINPARNNGFVLRKLVGGAEDKFVYLNADGRIYFYLFNCMSGTSLPSADVVAPNEWTHVAATYDGSFARIYLNGQASGLRQTTANCDVADSSGNWVVGFGNGAYFQGAIDDLRVYQRTLTDTEINQLYHQSTPWRIQGTAPWGTDHTVTCKNVTQGTEATLPATKRDDWNCEGKGGVKAAPGDTVQVIIDGTRK